MATRTEQSLDILRQALEEFESRLLEFEEALEGEELERKETVHPRSREGPPQLLSIPEIREVLGMGKSWVYRRLKGGGDARHKDEALRRTEAGGAVTELYKYLESRRYHPTEGGAPGEESPRRAHRHRHHRCS